ncbi:MAG: hypothetical protein IKV59_00600 [Lachnospiraceae bacterium]|nr:hypothetical protein [Lachnospiraceae bacterium]
MKQKKSRFFTFLFSFIPGAAEMYMGFMKNGISLMAAFFLSFMIPSILRMSNVFVLFGALIWFYGFFHAGNLASCSNEELQNIPDEFLWDTLSNGRPLDVASPVFRKWTAAILIFCGVVLLWENVSSLLRVLAPEWVWSWLAPFVSRVPQVAVALLLIYIGVKLIRGKKEELYGEEQ